MFVNDFERKTFESSLTEKYVLIQTFDFETVTSIGRITTGYIANWKHGAQDHCSSCHLRRITVLSVSIVRALHITFFSAIVAVRGDNLHFAFEIVCCFLRMAFFNFKFNFKLNKLQRNVLASF